MQASHLTRPLPRTPEKTRSAPLDFLQPQFADDGMDADWSNSVLTNADNFRICDFCWDYNRRSGATAHLDKWRLLDSFPTTFAVHSKGTKFYTMFVFSISASSAMTTLQHSWFRHKEDGHPQPTCIQGAAECEPDEACTEAVDMNTLFVAQAMLVVWEQVREPGFASFLFLSEQVLRLMDVC